MQMEEAFDRLEAGTLESPNELETWLPSRPDRPSGPEIRENHHGLVDALV
jgi:hypothetical protein